MSLQFASGDEIRWSASAWQPTGAWSWAAVFRILDTNDVNWLTYHGGYTAGNAYAIGTGRRSNSELYSSGGSGSIDSAIAHDDSIGWLFACVTKSAGSSIADYYIYSLTSGVWLGNGDGTPTPGGVSNPNQSTINQIRWGLFNGTDDPFVGRLCVDSGFNSKLSQADVNSLVSSFTRANWLSKSPTFLVDELDVFQTDHSGNGAARTSLTGTSDSGDDPPGWDSWSGVGAYVGAGAAAVATSGNITPALPASLATDDALILDITALDNVDCSVAVSGGSGNAWTRKGALDNGAGLRKEVWWKRRGAGDADTAAAVTHADGGKIIGRVHAWRVPGTGDPFEAFSLEAVSAAASGDFPDITTLTADAELAYGLGYAEDFTTGPSISAAQGLTLTERDETELP